VLRQRLGPGRLRLQQWLQLISSRPTASTTKREPPDPRLVERAIFVKTRLVSLSDLALS